MEWIALTCFAALNQAIRTALQKRLGQQMPAVFTAWVRFAFGAPLALGYLLVWMAKLNWPKFTLAPEFWTFMLLAAISQVLATVASVALLTRSNFAVGTSWIKTEAVFTLALALVWIGDSLTPWQITAVFISTPALLLLSLKQSGKGWRNWLDYRVMMLGLGAGFGFALCSIALREAILAVELDHPQAPWLKAAFTLTLILFVQTLIAGIWSAKQVSLSQSVRRHWRAALLIGITSVLGSIGWFSAMAMQSSALVKALGQVEFIFTLLITWWVFKEPIKGREYVAMALLLASILMLFLGAA